MILINMMMAIINLAFEEIKSAKDAYQNKFEIMEYIKRSTKELVGTGYVYYYIKNGICSCPTLGLD